MYSVSMHVLASQKKCDSYSKINQCLQVRHYLAVPKCAGQLIILNCKESHQLQLRGMEGMVVVGDLGHSNNEMLEQFMNG